MSSDATFGQIVKERRRLLGLTQAELANRVSCAPITIRRIEAGNLRPSFQLAELLALSLNIPEAEQLGFVRLARQQKPSTPIPKPTPSPGEIGMADLSGRAVKGFQLGELIGSGGFGVVYRAVQPSVKRDVAVKIILPRFANQPDFIRRFESEAHLVARLEHPHIVPLYDYWREPDAAYLIMRLLRGGSLEEQLKSGPLPLTDFERIVPQICAALATAHRHGVIHRDIKPANVMLDEDKNAYLTDFGIAKNLDASEESQLTQGGVMVGSPAYISPEQILAEPVRAQSDIYCLGVMLYEMLTGQKPFPGPTSVAFLQQHLNDPLPLLHDLNSEFPPAFDDVIQQATAKRPENRYENTLDLLADLEQGWQTAVSPTTATSLTTPNLSAQELAALENPYRGLRAFTEADAANFYGRSALVQELLGMMADGSDLSRFIAVVGPSGSGKSSVVKAGLIPALRRGGLPNSDNWFMVDLTPGTHPWEEVEAALLRVAVNPPDSLLTQLRDGERGLQRSIRRILPDDNETELVMVIDQFEELFTLVADEAVRAEFLEGLVTAVLDPKSRLRLIITLRADFTDRPLQYVDFGELMRRRTAFVLPLTPNELTDAITRPVTQLGMEMEPALVSTIVREVGDQPGMLPLMQYALTELFEQRQSRTLTPADYESTGGVLGALARRADEIYNRLEPDAQEAARQLFLRLITLGEGVEDTRRRVLISELQTLRVSETIRVLEQVIEKYGRYRLLTFDHDPVSREATAEVAHEALLREWPRLRNWLTDSREDVRRQRLLANAAHQWTNAAQDDSYLLRGSRLVAFESWAETTTVAFTETEAAFLQHSLAARDRREAEEEARRQRELETVRQLAEEQTRRAEEQAAATQSLRQRALFLTGALVLAAILAVAAFGFARSSNNNANLASIREAEALANLDLAATNEADAVREANQRATAQAETELERERADEERDTAVSAQATAENAAIIRATAEAAAIQEKNIAEEQTLLSNSRELALASINNLNVDPERSLLLARQALDYAYTNSAEIALRRALQQSRLMFRFDGHHNETVGHVIYHPNGVLAASTGQDEALIWNIFTGEVLVEIPVKNVSAIGSAPIDFTPDGSLLAVGDDNGRVILYNSENGEMQQTWQGTEGFITSLTISPDGTLLAAGSNIGELFVWDLENNVELFTIQASKEGWVNQVDFSPDSSRLGTTGDDFMTRLWDSRSGNELLSLGPTPAFPLALSFTPEGSHLYTSLSGATNQDIYIWDVSETAVSTDEPASILTGMHENLIIDILFNSDGTHFVTASLDSLVKVWDASAPADEPLIILAGHSGNVLKANFSPDGQTVISSGHDGIRIWNVSLAGPGEIQSFSAHDIWINKITYSPDGNSIASAGSDGLIQIWDTATGKLQQTLAGHAFDVWSIAYNPDGSLLASAGFDKTIRIWNSETGEQIQTLEGHGDGIVGSLFEGVLTVDFNPDGSLLASGGADGTVRIWDAGSGEQVEQFTPHPDGSGITRVQFSPDGQRLAVATDTSPILVIWDMAQMAIAHINDMFDSPRIWVFDHSPDGRFLAIGESGGRLALYHAKTGELAFELPGHASTTLAVDFSPDSSSLVTAGTDGAVKIWDIESQLLMLDLPGHASSVESVLFSPNGQYITTAGQELIIRTFTLNLDELIAIADSRVTRTLTETECQQYLHVDTCPAN